MKKNLVITLIISLAIALQACKPVELVRAKLVKPMQEYHNCTGQFCGVDLLAKD